MHPAVNKFCTEIRDRFPEHFKGARVLDCGSLDINGNNRYLFEDCDYTGIDVGEGKNVDEVSLIHEHKTRIGDCGKLFSQVCCYDTIISTEAFEHDAHLRESIKRIVKLLRPGGLFLFTCATTGRHEHGTIARSKSDCPLTEWDHYENVTPDMIEDLLNGHLDGEFRTVGTDLQYWGIK